MNTRLIYITTGNIDEARHIGRQLVESGLAACANIISNMESLYQWQGQLQQDREVVLLLKTTDSRVNDVIEKTRQLHSYDCPCILSLAIDQGNSAFIQWIEQQTT